jgi:hypothetical protein
VVTPERTDGRLLIILSISEVAFLFFLVDFLVLVFLFFLPVLGFVDLPLLKMAL